MNDPKRLADPGAGSSEELRGMLLAARADLPGSDRARGIAMAASAIAVGIAGSAEAASAGAAAGSTVLGTSAATALKVGLATLAVGGALAGGGATWKHVHARRSAPVVQPTPNEPLLSREAPARVAPPTESIEATAPSEPTPVAKPPEAIPPEAFGAPAPLSPPRAVAPLPTRGPASASSPLGLGAAPATSAPAPFLDERAPSERAVAEVDLLRDAESRLRTDPAAALALTDEHARRFADGMLAQERQVVAIEALVRLGRVDEACARAEQFVREAPDSAHRIRVEALVNGAEDSSHKP